MTAAPDARSSAVPLVAALDTPGVPDAALGGKGAWLRRLVAAGFPVPPTVILTTEAYRRAIRTPDLARLIDELRRAGGTGGPGADAIDAAFLAAPLDLAVSDAIGGAAARVLVDGGPRLAARSSASAEDLHGTSFAGQYTSLLEVDPDGVDRAVRLVWASLWHPAPRAYRAAQGVAEDDLAMAVVLMRQVPADQAGVVFTVDPGADRDDRVRVEGVAGLGERLVSGAETPWVCHVPRDAGDDEAVACDGDAPAGTAALARRVASVALEIEGAFGEPQDVEWAVAGDDLFVLQARPITSVGARDDGFDSTTDDRTRWTTAGIAEMLPGVLPPLQWELSRWLVENGLRRHFARLGVLPADIDETGGFLGRFRGRAALRLDTMELVAAAMPGGDTAQVEEQYFGIASSERAAAPASHLRSLRGLRHARALARERREALREAATVAVAAAYLAEDEPTVDGLDTTRLLAYRRRALDLGARAMVAEVAVASSAVAAYRRLELVLMKRLDAREASHWAQRLTSGAARSAGPDLPAARASRSVFAGPTWAESGGMPPGPDPDGASTSPTEAAWEELIARLHELHGWTSTRALTGQVVDVRLVVLRRLVEDANELLAEREAAKAAVLSIGGAVRRTHLELGRRLVAAGELDEATEVDLLSERELTGLVPRPTRAEVGRRRRWLAGQTEAPLPQRFRGRPRGVSADAAEGDVLHGWAAGPGRRTGRARVLRSPVGATIDEGDVVVAAATDASWTPVFLRAGAIVVEQGGPLSHAAIVARELGIPAVLNVPGVVARLSGTDVLVTVDGDEGLVQVLGDPEAVPA